MMRFTRFTGLLVVIGTIGLGQGSTFAQSLDGSGLKTAVAVDIVRKAGAAGVGREGLLEVRGAEVVIYSPADHFFGGLLNVAGHAEASGNFYGIHEAYLSSTKLIPRTRFRVGQFFLGVGRLNRFHRHDWPFISAPKVQSEFFDEEGVLDTGIEASILLPTDFFWDLTLGVTNGWVYGHSHTIGTAPELPTHYLRSAHYIDLPADGGMEWGINYLGRRNSEGTLMQLVGIDSTAKWRDEKSLRFLVQSEVWMRTFSPRTGAPETTVGGYFFPQYGITPQAFLGVRGDFYSITSLVNVAGAYVNNGTYAIVPTLTWKPSEFVRLNGAFTLEYVVAGGTSQLNHAFEVQATYILGAHPAHNF